MTIHRTTTTIERLRPDTCTAITTILAHTEATTHRYGWDQPPVLFGLFDHQADGAAMIEVDPSITEPGLWTTPDPRRPGMPLPVPVILHRLATDLTSHTGRRWLDGWLHTNGRTCVGVGLVFEAWAGPIRPGYRYGDLAKAPAGQRREIRVVAAVDTDLGLHRVIRVRGTDTPRVDHWTHPPAGSRHRRIVTGLHRLVHLVRNH
ncbi:hypothetical protein EDC02_5004 [Micromonospora sp. Llam0]|uniref:hypothetical protein n=1 Tax=Micromonospora sp. Llam0 TaxID=2485143 RepID=UPI000F48C50B|nr:hypothetical protein [Micromonospora sp. Llam0]ROO62995.1 hypothetical protein EDC02_5004 [Micromonospora sp. Llam0]